jgi:hypothetical protein
MSDTLAVPDLWQLEALRLLRSGKDVVLQAPTGAGKTLVFERLAESGLAGQAVYAVPTRALANDKLAEWRERGWDVGIATGDRAENLGAKVVVATLETQRETLLGGRGPALLVVDEYQMLMDPERGPGYETCLALAPPDTQLLLLSGSVSNPGAVVEWLGRLGRDAAAVVELRRPVPLEEVNLDTLDQSGGDARNPLVRALLRGLRADLGPILVFAPRRRAATQLAEELAAALPHDGGPGLTPEERRLAGEDLSRLLRRGVGLHHSGLTYLQRAGLVEPLAKSGRLRVVVATTGLAAGINFSLRSVLVTDRLYMSGHRLREVRPDELLQMFGRAGRRGLDDRGHALRTGDTPRLAEARPLQLRRAEGLDWGAFLRRMDGAVDPKAEAAALAARLMTREPVDLALDRLGEPEPAAERGGEAPTVRRVLEMQGRDGSWQRLRPTRWETLGRALIRVRDAWHPALEKPDSLRSLPFGTPCRLDPGGGSTPRHGRLVPLAALPAKGDRLIPAPWLAKLLRQPEHVRLRRGDWTLGFIERTLIPLLPRLTQGGEAAAPPEFRGETLQVRLDYAKARVRVTPDADDHPLINPRRREIEKEDIRLEAALGGGEARGAKAGRLWLRLGLVDGQGAVTRRGRIAARFQHGEGLAVAAALEDAGYEPEDLAWDLAELRAGERLASLARSSSRLAASSRLAYRSLTAEGYLRDGLPEAFGEGTAELLRARALHGKTPPGLDPGLAGHGDLERAVLEWRSTLRLVANAPDLGWERWEALRQSARLVLARIGG